MRFLPCGYFDIENKSKKCRPTHCVVTTPNACEETNHRHWPQKRFTTIKKMSSFDEELLEHDLTEKNIQMDQEMENYVQNCDATDAAEKDSTVVGAAHVAEGHMEKHSAILEDETDIKKC